jgi:hypothetical protein
VTNTTSADVPQNQAQFRQNNGCSASAIAEGDNNCSTFRSFLGFGQVVTSSDPLDQQTALTNLDQIPVSSGTKRGELLPLKLNPGQGTCTSDLTVTNSNPAYCPNNAANFGSVTGTIGGNRAFTMGFHITY